jgi:NAD(P)-dependent dehydrogenase (short-subunit alcohol dehydrogenase family)
MDTYLFAGASSKIALETARLLKENGHKVIGISTKTENILYDEFYSVEKYDFTTFPAIDGAIDGLVYFPGTINLKPFNRLSPNDFMNDYQVNSLGAVAFVQAYLNNLKQSTNASVVFISTVAVATGMPYHSSVSMAKGAIEGLTKALAAEFAPAIRVNCIAPSLADTPLAEKFINTPEKLAASQKRNPLKKIGSATDIANAVTFLLGSQAAWITGQVLAVDGGMNNLRLM